MAHPAKSQPARRIWAPVFACGLLGCMIGGIAGAGTFIFATWNEGIWQSSYGGPMAFYSLVAGCVLSAPLNLVLLPVTWASFLRSRRRTLIVGTVGFLGGGLTMAYLLAQPGMTLRPLSPTELGAIILVGAVAGLISARLFTRLLG